MIGEEQVRLKSWLRDLEPKAGCKIELRARANQFSRKVALQVAWAKGLLTPPQGRTGPTLAVTYLRVYAPSDENLVSSLKNCLKKFEAIFLHAGALRSR